MSGGALQLNMGTLYPALMRLEQRGLVLGIGGPPKTNRKARFYALHAAGRRQLAKEKQAWDRMVGIIHTLVHGGAEFREITCASFANGFSVFRERQRRAGATPTWNTSSESHVEMAAEGRTTSWSRP